MLSFLQNTWSNWFFRWLDRRSPPTERVTLYQNNLYILPSGPGYLFILLAILLWLLGTNYQNNLILGLSLLLIAVFLLSIIFTYANLSGLQLTLLTADPVFCGDAALPKLVVTEKSGRVRDNLQLQWQQQQTIITALVQANQQTEITIPYNTQQRGYQKPNRLLLATSYPLGLIRCWTWLNFNVKILVYPKPIRIDEPPVNYSDNDLSGQAIMLSSDEFQQFRNYRPGDSLRHIAWKPYAAERGLLVKDYVEPLAQDHWLDWQTLGHLPTEMRLSGMCYWALQYFQQQIPYGLRLPGIEIMPEHSQVQHRRVLKSLATFAKVDKIHAAQATP